MVTTSTIIMVTTSTIILTDIVTTIEITANGRARTLTTRKAGKNLMMDSGDDDYDEDQGSFANEYD